MNKMKVLIGLNTYNDIHFLKESVPVLDEMRKTLNATAVVLDTAQSDLSADFFAKNFPEFNYIRHPDGNIGYGRSYGEILRQFPGFDYLILVTSDVVLDINTVKKMLAEMEKDKDIKLAAGKMHYFDFEKKERTNKIDSLGIAAKKRHYFYDRGQGEVDSGQYDSTLDKFFGLTGAAFIIRISVIPELHGNPYQIFDDRMWMYKEDIDLSYRLRWLGKKIKMFPEVWGWHARTVTKKGKKKPYAILHSYKNHLLLLKNNFSLQFGLSAFFQTFIFELAKAFYMLIFHPLMFMQGMKTLFTVKGEKSKRLVSPKTILSYFD